MPRIIDPHVDAMIITRFKSGESTRSIAKGLGKSIQTVYNTLERGGVDLKRRSVSEKQRARLIDLCKRGMSVSRAATWSGMSPSTATRVIREYRHSGGALTLQKGRRERRPSSSILPASREAPTQQTRPPLFYLGVSIDWASHERVVDVPLFISFRKLRTRRRLPDIATHFALDSGGFTELQMNGRWTISAHEYAEKVRKMISFYKSKLMWVAPQDWMCEPIILAGGHVRGVGRFIGTGLTVEEHQTRTVRNFAELRAEVGDRVIPVLQGFHLHEYQRCAQMYLDAGFDLTQEPVVGLGTVCRRQATSEAEVIVRALARDGVRLHGFGFKKTGLIACGDALVSADSMAWTVDARYQPPLPGHEYPGPGRSRGHARCSNCIEFALAWRDSLIARLENRKRGRHLE